MSRTKFINSVTTGVSLTLFTVILLGLFSPARSQEVSLKDAYEIGQVALIQGDVDYAEDIAKAILKEDPDNVQGYLLLSSVNNIKGDFEVSRDAAKSAYKLSVTEKQKYNSALAIGTAEANQKKQITAEYWLRKSLNYAADFKQKNFAASLIQEVRQNSPWRRSFSFGITPSSNVNGGSSANEILINDLEFILDPNAKSIKGLGFNYGLGLSYRKQITGDATFLWSTDVSGVIYKIYPTAEQDALGVRGADYDYHRASMRTGYALGNDHALKWFRQMVFLTEFSQDWYGGNVLANTVGVSASKSVSLNETSRLYLKLAYEKRFREDLKERTSTAKMMDVRYDKLLSNNDYLSLSVYGIDRSSRSAEIGNIKLGMDVSYKLNPRNLSFQPEFLLGYEQALFDRPFLSTERRLDKKITVGISVKLLKVSYFGFNPTLGYTFQKVTSNINLYDSYSHFFKVGLQSQF